MPQYMTKEQAIDIARSQPYGPIRILAHDYQSVLRELEDIHAKLVELSTILSDDAEEVQALADYLTRFKP